ncbi:patatin-like phospholipase family protein [Paraburkholderia rhizosphaerae]|uniref:NTE family protein n=1 Tax=Paraburkholderia rhizosphaerae TaxID=480658 RepID=A0A4R8LLB7_9BURK|nr:patatin-like phospholipase family protein [Paraburkholderia rhizosphaerae]TDY45387.1 NTE family protein [Paraburkholderia rhizosphaerae]
MAARLWKHSAILVVTPLLLLGGCATRPVNPPIKKYNPEQISPFDRLDESRDGRQDMVILAFSGGGMRAAAFSYGTLETLQRIEVTTTSGKKIRLLDEVDLITGVSGGSFTALAYGMYGEQLFNFYEHRFLKRNVQGELIARILNPLNWPALASAGWSRSEIAAQLYDEILFNDATFAELERTGGPMIAVSSTELTTGSRIVFLQQNFDVMCADLGPFKLSRAAAASSAVPVVLAPITINNYGGTCGYEEPAWILSLVKTDRKQRSASRILNRLQDLREIVDATQNPYLHLVDGGVADNLGLRGVLDFIGTFEALHEAGQPAPLDNVRRLIIFVVNAASSPSTSWNLSERPPGGIRTLVQAVGVPIDRFSAESVELLQDIKARWALLRQIRHSDAFADNKDPALAQAVEAPDTDIYVVDVSFDALSDKSERGNLNQLPTSLALPDDAIDRLRSAARTIILASPEFQEALERAGARIIDPPETVNGCPLEQGEASAHPEAGRLTDHDSTDRQCDAQGKQ